MSEIVASFGDPSSINERKTRRKRSGKKRSGRNRGRRSHKVTQSESLAISDLIAGMRKIDSSTESGFEANDEPNDDESTCGSEIDDGITLM